MNHDLIESAKETLLEHIGDSYNPHELPVDELVEVLVMYGHKRIHAVAAIIAVTTNQ